MLEIIEGIGEYLSNNRYLIIIHGNFCIDQQYRINCTVNFPEWEVKNFSDAEDKRFETWEEDLDTIKDAIHYLTNKMFVGKPLQTLTSLTLTYYTTMFLALLKQELDTKLKEHWIIYHITEETVEND